MGDRIVVMKDGVINQVDTPMNLYNKPINKFVAGFIGSPAMNFISTILTNDNKLTSKSSKLIIDLNSHLQELLNKNTNKDFTIGIRPENIQLEKSFDNSIEVETKLDVIEPMGNETFIHFSIDDAQFIARVNPAKDLQLIEKIKLFIDANSIYIFDPGSGNVII
jgi:multiple sugar transport system ATP-binding protein